MKKHLLPLSLSLLLMTTPAISPESNKAEARRGGGHRGGHMRGRRGGRRGMRGRRGRRGMGGMGGWGRRGRRGRGRMYGYGGGRWGGWARPHHRFRSYGWGGGWSNPYYYGGGGGFGYNYPATNTIGAGGGIYPAYSFNYSPASYSAADVPASITSKTWTSASVSAVPVKTIEPKEPKEKIEFKSKFKLGPDADIIGDGMIAFHLDKNAFLLVNNKKMVVVDQNSGNPALELFPDEVLIWHLNQELGQQAHGLRSAAKERESAMDSAHVSNSEEKKKALKTEISKIYRSAALLDKARQNLGKVPAQIPAKEALPEQDAIEIFASTWMKKDGSLIIARIADGSYIYLDGKGTYEDEKKTPLKRAYPAKYETIVFGYLNKLIAESKDTVSQLKDDLDNTEWTIERLKEELKLEVDGAEDESKKAKKKGSKKDSDEIPGITDSALAESKRSIDLAIRRSEHRFAALTNQIKSMPDEVKAAKKLIANLKGS